METCYQVYNFPLRVLNTSPEVIFIFHVVKYEPLYVLGTCLV